MRYTPPAAPFRPNVDRFGMPKDYETYQWATYGPGAEIAPERRAFLYGRPSYEWPRLSDAVGTALPMGQLFDGYLQIGVPSIAWGTPE